MIAEIINSSSPLSRSNNDNRVRGGLYSLNPVASLIYLHLATTHFRGFWTHVNI